MADIKRYDELMEEACANMIARQNKITDFNEGSIIHTILDTFCRIVERVYIAIRSGFNQGLIMLIYSVFKFEKKSGTYASGKVTFSRASALDARTVIPSGVKVSGNGFNFVTTEAGAIEAGAVDSDEITIKAEEAGSDYNLEAGAITSIDSSVPSDISAVTNKNTITGGTNEETDAEVEERFTKKLAGLSGTNLFGIEDAALSVDSVRSVSVKNHKPPLKNVYNVSVYVDDGSGTASNELLQEVKKAVEGTETQNGHLAPGVNARYLAPTAVPVDFEIEVSTGEVDTAETQAEIKKIVQSYVNSLRIGGTVILSTIVAKIRALSYVSDVTIKSPTENFTVNSEQIARFGNAEITVVES